MYAVIAIVHGKYVNLKPSELLSITEARRVRDLVDSSTKPLIVNDYKVQEAIELNNKSL